MSTPARPAMPPGWDRFARWPRGPARLALAALAALIVAALVVPIHGARTVPTRSLLQRVTGTGGHVPPRPRDADLALYDRIVARVAHGEDYYDVVVAEQRRSGYPMRPGLTVRLPTLALIDAALGARGQMVAAIALTLGVLAAWWRRLHEEPGGREHRAAAMALLLFGAAMGLNSYYFVLHELWAGMLLALAFGLHRPGPTPRQSRWGAALAAAALALAIRETALPFVLLMAALAGWRRGWREAIAWIALAAAFAVALAWHLHLIAAQALPGDRVSAPWLVARGLSGWLSNVVLASNLRFFWRAPGGVAVVLSLLGWAGWRSWAGVYGFWLFAGYGVFFMLAGRWDNFYWGAIVAPAMFAALAFVPRELVSLARAGFTRGPPACHPRGAAAQARRS